MKKVFSFILSFILVLEMCCMRTAAEDETAKENTDDAYTEITETAEESADYSIENSAEEISQDEETEKEISEPDDPDKLLSEAPNEILSASDSDDSFEEVSSASAPPSEETIITETADKDDNYQNINVEEADSAVYASDNETDGNSEVTVPFDLSDRILQAGSFFAVPETVSDEETSDFSIAQYDASGKISLNDLFVNAALEREPSIDVSDYNIPVDRADITYSNLVNSNPQLFFVNYSGSYTYNTDTGIIVAFHIQYLDEYDSSSTDRFNQRVDWFISGLESSWTDEQKALYLHDKLIVECEYEKKDSSGKYHNYNAYNVLVDGEAVCQGYALAYKYLLAQAGIYSEIITSNELNHAWNTVVINGKEYYTDCTWDDPVGAYRMYCGHENFLRNSSAFYWETEHNKLDWLDQNGNYVINTVGQDEYPVTYWRYCTSQIPHVGNLWAYMRKDSVSVYIHNYSTGADSVLTSQLNDYWDVFEDPSSYYTNCQISLEAYQNMFIASQQKSASYISTSGAVSLIGNISGYEASIGRVYGIQLEGNRLRYDLHTAGNTNRAGYGYFVLSNTGEAGVHLNVKNIEMVEGSTFNLYSYLVTNASSVSWASSNIRIATANSGVINAIKPGTVKISVRNGSQNDTCTVTVYPNKNGLIHDDDDEWRLYSVGKVRESFTGLYPYGTSLFYLTNGVLDRTVNGIYYTQGTPYYVVNGQVTYNYTGLGEYKGTLFYFTKSVKNEAFNGIAYYKNNPYYVVNGKVTFNYTGLGEYKGALHYFTDSLKNTSFTGISYYKNEPYYVLNGIVSYNYTGLGKYKSDWWYVVNSRVSKSFSGQYKWKNSTYTIRNGKVVK